MSERPKGWGAAELEALGSIAVNFTELDWYAYRLLAGFIKPRDVATLLTAGEPIQWKFDKLSAIAEEALADPLDRSTLLGWVEASRTLVERRNKLMHSFYLASEGEQASTRLWASTRGGKWKGHIEPLGLAELRVVAALLAEGLEVAARLVDALTVRPEWHDPAAPSSTNSVRNAVSDSSHEQAHDG